MFSWKGMVLFGPFELNTRTGELRKNGTRVKLPAQSFQLLALLVERSGELVTRDEIRRVLWPNETVVEWEHSINTAVKRIRAALNDSAAAPRYLETLPRRGYRFIAQPERKPAEKPDEKPAEESDPVGKTLAHYRVLEELGRGGMGIVYKAEDILLGRMVALKFLPEGLENDPVALERFRREARTASALNHPNICTIYEIEVHQGRGFIAMELLEGETLRDRLVRGPGFTTSQLLDIGIQVANALEAAHARAVIHRDIKPANIFLTRRGDVKVLDFGVAKSALNLDLTETGITPGTLAYMSPEQARGEDLDARTDLYSFGAVLHEMASGRRFDPAPLPPTITRNHPPKLWEMIGRLLDTDADLRYQTAGDVASELKRLKRDISSPHVPVQPARRPAWRVAAIVGAAVVLVAAAVLWRTLSSPERPAAPLLAKPLTTDRGFHIAADFSPDGKQVVYCWNGYQEDNYDIYTLTIGSNEPRRLTTDADIEFSPAWSPDGRSIAFLKGPDGGVATLMVMPAAGGPARKISDTGMQTSPVYKRIEWSPDGRWIVMEDGTSAAEGYGLILVSVETGERRQLTQPRPNQADLEPAFTPDGRTLAYAKDVGNGVSLIYLLSLNSQMMAEGQPERVAFPGFENVIAGHPRWLDGRRELIFTATRGGALRLWRGFVHGSSPPVPLASLGEEVRFPAVSRDGKRLVFSRSRVDANIWSSGTEPGGAAPQKVAWAQPPDRVPAFSPDGSRMVFESDRAGSPEIWVAGRDGGAARQLTFYGGPITGSPRWSPDGKWIVYDSRVEGQPEIYVVSAEGGAPRRMTNDPAADVMPSWSPDGRWIYFCSSRSGTRQVWRLPSSGGLAEQITRYGGCMAMSSPDGKTIFYQKASAPFSSLWKVPADGGEELLVVNNVANRCFAVSKGRLYYAAKGPAEEHLSLRYLDLAANKVTTIRTLAAPLQTGFAVTPEGTTLLYWQVDRRGSDLMLVNGL